MKIWFLQLAAAVTEEAGNPSLVFTTRQLLCLNGYAAPLSVPTIMSELDGSAFTVVIRTEGKYGGFTSENAFPFQTSRP